MTTADDRRLIIVSNRVAMPKKDGAAAGGLAVGVLAALEDHGGVWFGWDGKLVESSEPGPPPGDRLGDRVERAGPARSYEERQN